MQLADCKLVQHNKLWQTTFVYQDRPSPISGAILTPPTAFKTCLGRPVIKNGGSIMVWGGITHGGRTALVHIDGTLTGVRFRDEILQGHFVPFMNANGGVFQHNNARPHVARICQQFLTENRVQVLPRPARSPDLLPIKLLWDMLG